MRSRIGTERGRQGEGKRSRGSRKGEGSSEER